MADIARLSPDKEISPRQRHMMKLMAWRYRRQLNGDLVPHSKPWNLPRKIKESKPAKAAKAVEPDSRQETLL